MDGEYQSFEGEIFTGVTDTSFYQDLNSTPARPDYKALYRSGVRANVHRISYNGTIDEDAEYNWKACQDAGVIPIAYGYLDYRRGIRKPATTQANIFIEHLFKINGKTENVLCYCDYEQPNASWPVLPPRSEGIQLLTDWYSIVDAETKRRAGIYGNRNTILSISPVPELTKTRSLWIAAYPYVRLVTHAEVARLSWRPSVSPWSKWDMWQFGFGDGNAMGMESKEIDMVFFRGDYKKLCEFTGYTPPPVVPPAIPQPIDIKANLATIRAELDDIERKVG